MFQKELQRIDLGMTIQYYIGKENLYQEEQCFTNVFEFLRTNSSFSSRIKIVFGYVLSEDETRKVAVRHAWNMIDEYVVDVTMPANGISPISILQYDYLPVQTFTATEYSVKLSELDGMACFPETEEELQIVEKLKKAGYEILK